MTATPLIPLARFDKYAPKPSPFSLATSLKESLILLGAHWLRPMHPDEDDVQEQGRVGARIYLLAADHRRKII